MPRNRKKLECVILGRLRQFLNDLKEENAMRDKNLEKIRNYCEISDRVNALSETDRLKWRTCMGIINDPNTSVDDRAMTINTMVEILK